MRRPATDATSSRLNTFLIVLVIGIGIELCILGVNLLPRRSQPVQNVAQVPSARAVATEPPPSSTPPGSEVVIPGSEITSAPPTGPTESQTTTLDTKWPVKWTVGHSVRGKPITGLRFGDGAETTFILGAFHGDEPGSHAVCMELVRYLETNPSIYANREVIIVPACNPDGLAARTRSNANRVDINRNWSYGWTKATGRGLSHGSEPMSEPEVQAIAALLAKYPPDKVINLHQAKNMLNPTGAGGVALAREMAKSNGLHVDTDIGYPTPGAFGDYCGKQLGAAMVTYELPGGANPWAGAKEALLAAIKFSVP